MVDKSLAVFSVGLVVSRPQLPRTLLNVFVYLAYGGLNYWIVLPGCSLFFSRHYTGIGILETFEWEQSMLPEHPLASGFWSLTDVMWSTFVLPIWSCFMSSWFFIFVLGAFGISLFYSLCRTIKTEENVFLIYMPIVFVTIQIVGTDTMIHYLIIIFDMWCIFMFFISAISIKCRNRVTELEVEE